ncbi:hypothetical protein HMP0721_0241 [Pseudoramibacter alactolyticus ATCC 23263]|uniref:Uncharacterized protein n=1 Tax=Pseudoramibacter alactolyticus ATCC 23263 TaxID=887929 RepID=E6ME08_9FIRM|nr:hypothetical protein HMP0721_0241 [Pseudoramibacter alactolyticus ATCC 23263]
MPEEIVLKNHEGVDRYQKKIHLRSCNESVKYNLCYYLIQL